MHKQSSIWSGEPQLVVRQVLKGAIPFENQKSVILEALPHLNIKVEHVGSTSVPGLSAEPIIDIVLENAVVKTDVIKEIMNRIKN